MKFISLALMMAFFSNQALAFYPQSDDLAADKTVQELESALDGAKSEDASSSKEDKIIKSLEKEIAKVESMNNETLARHVNKKFKRADRRFRRVSRQFKRLSKKQGLVQKLSLKTGQSPDEIRQSFLDQAKTFAPEKMVKTLKEGVEEAGGYLNFLNEQLNEAKRLASQVANKDHKSGRYIASDHGLVAVALVALYVLITPYLLFTGLIIGLIGLALLLVTGGAVGALALIGLGVFAAGVPGLIIISIWN